MLILFYLFLSNSLIAYGNGYRISINFMALNKADVTTQSVSTQSFLDEDIFKSYIFQSLGNVVLPSFYYKIDSICLEGWTHVESSVNVTSHSDVPFNNNGEFAYQTLQVAFVGEAFLERAAVSEDGCGVLMRLEGNISKLWHPSTDHTGVLDRLPPYSLSVLANVLSLSLLHLVPPFPRGVLTTSLTAMAASSLLAAVIAVSAAPRLELLFLLSVSVVVVLAQTARAAWRQRHGTTLTLGTAFDVLAFVLGELSSVETVSVRGVAARLRDIKEKLCSDGGATGVMELRWRYGSRPIRMCFFICLLLTLFVIDFFLVLLGIVAVGAIMFIMFESTIERDMAPLAAPSARIDEDHAKLATAESVVVLEETVSVDPVPECHGIIEEERCDVATSDSRVKEAPSVESDGGLEEAERRFCVEFAETARPLLPPVIACWSARVIPRLCAIESRIVEQPSEKEFASTDCPYSGSEDDGSKSEKESHSCVGSQSSPRTAYFEDSMVARGLSETHRRSLSINCLYSGSGSARSKAEEDSQSSAGSQGRQRASYSMNAVVARGLNVAEEEPESICALHSVLESGIRVTMMQRCDTMHSISSAKHRDEIELRYRYEYLQGSCLRRFFNTMSIDLYDTWRLKPPAAVDALCVALLEDPRVRSGLTEVAQRLPHSGPISLCAFRDTAIRHIGSRPLCEHCTAICELPQRFWDHERTRPIEACLARVRLACLQEFDDPPHMHPSGSNTPATSPPAFRLMYKVTLNACLHRVRLRCLHLALAPPPSGT